jgi:hypothetical protein
MVTNARSNKVQRAQHTSFHLHPQAAGIKSNPGGVDGDTASTRVFVQKITPLEPVANTALSASTAKCR